tara:strand:+ start:281 stop:1354 length:1074 start_codon:yes stop_codon:yes gene_type:complete
MKSVYIFTEIVDGQHSRISLYNLLSTLLKKRGFNLVIVQYGLTSEASIIHDNFDIVRCKDFPSRYLQLFRILSLISYRDLVVIGGYGHFYLWIVRIFSIFRTSSIFCWLGSSSRTSNSNSVIANMVKQLFLKSITSIITYGKDSSDYYRKFLPSSKIYTGMNCSDTNYFSEINFSRTNYFDTPTQKLKILVVSRLVEHKGVPSLLRELKISEMTIRHNIDVNIIGDGPYKFDPYCYDLSGVRFLGSKGVEDVRNSMIHSNILIQPTLYDPYSRVLSEALSTGMFVVASKYDSSTSALLDNPYVELYDPRIPGSLEVALNKIIYRFNRKKILRSDIFSQSPFDINKYALTLFNMLMSD